jgi:hypothetical protein
MAHYRAGDRATRENGWRSIVVRKAAISVMLVAGVFTGLTASQGVASADDYVPGVTGLVTPPEPGMVPAGVWPSWDACQAGGRDGAAQGRWRPHVVCWRLTENDMRLLWVTPL